MEKNNLLEASFSIPCLSDLGLNEIKMHAHSAFPLVVGTMQQGYVWSIISGKKKNSLSTNKHVMV